MEFTCLLIKLKLFIIIFVEFAECDTLIPDRKCDFIPTAECVGIFDCKIFDDFLNRTVIPRKDFIGVISKSMCGLYKGPRGEAPKVCCRKSDIKNNNLVSHKNYRLLPNDMCGPVKHSFRITHGTSTLIGEFPWMALLIYQDDGGLTFRCAGTIISKKYILTAAHCIINSVILGIRLGEHNINTTIDCMNNQCAPRPRDFLIDHIHMHPNYRHLTMENDIALIRLSSEINWANVENISPICLPTLDINLVGKNAIAAGWGVTELGITSEELKKTTIPIKPIRDCQRLYGHVAPVSENQICGGGEDGRDTCSGDSGGPLQYIHDFGGIQRFVQCGIVSYGPQICGALHQPAVYTKVFNYMGWILDTMEP